MQQSLLTAAIAALLGTSLAAQNTPAPCWEPNLGTNLGLTDDSVAQGQALGFTFTGPGNVQVTSIDVSSNGFVWLGSNTDPACCNGDPLTFVTDMARLAPLWMDLNPSQSGNVYFNTFAATPTSLARAVVTWDGVPEYGGSQTFSVQLQILADGSFVFTYDGQVSNLGHDVLVGCTEGVTATANTTDFSAITTSSPYVGGTNPTIFEVQQLLFDHAGRSFEFVPNGTGSYIVLDRGCVFASSQKFGRGCPQPAVAYELFPQSTVDLSNTAIDFMNTGAGYLAIPTTGFFTGYAGAVTTGDDVVSGPFTLPFTFNFPGGSTTGIDISSNGFVWLSTGNFDPRCCYGDPTLFVFDGPSIAALWQDLNPSQGGAIYYDVDPNNTEVHITWVGVPEYYNGGANTFQITLRSDGSFRLSWQTVVNQSHDCLVGFSQGNGAVDPGSMDLSASLPFTIGTGGTPVALGAAAGSRPALGTTFVMETSAIPAGSLAAFMAFGFASLLPGNDLGAFGAPGCSQHVSLDATQFFLLTGDPTPYLFPIPNGIWLIGVTLHAQALTLSPGINALGAATSNGLSFTIGQ